GRGRRRLVVACEGSFDGRDGQRVDWRWTASGDARLGLPGEFEQDVFMALQELLAKRGGLDEGGGLEFSNYELLRTMGRGTDDKRYRMVRPALRRLAGVRFSSERSFFDAGRGRVLAEKDFGLCGLERVEVVDPSGRVRENNRVVFDPVFVGSYRVGYIERLDMEFYKSLRLPTSKRLFGMATERCEEGGTWRVGLHTLRDAMPLGGYAQAAHIWAALGRPHEELLSRGFLAGVERLVGADGRPEVAYRLAKGFGARRQAEGIRASREGRVALELLEACGLGRVAAGLIAEHGPARCEEMARATLSAVAGGAAVRSKAALCRWNLKENDEFVLPSDARPAGARGGAKGRATAVPAAPGAAGSRKREAERRREGYEWLFGDDG
ncbi:MAG: replication initiator protein A, partial [Actinomycetota bacterium]|nr:replication initiator protein A [Actinomycetota bacterium]